MTPRRPLLGALLALAVLLPVSACTSSSDPRAKSASSAPVFTTPSSGAASPTSSTDAMEARLAGLGAPIGWKLSDVPHFDPPPPPEPVTLPTGNRSGFYFQIPTKQKIAFLTIDDGALHPTEGPKLLAAAHIPVTLFMTTNFIAAHKDYFGSLRKYGAVIEDHTISHPELKGKSAAFVHHQICDSSDLLGQWYGRRPLLFRPPFGDKDANVLQVAKGCGLKAGFYWRETVDKGIVRYQDGNSVKPGDIILMHFRPAFIQDFLAALHAIKKAGLTPALLENYIPGATAGVDPANPGLVR